LILELLSQILQRAADYGYVERNPMKAGDRKDRYLPEFKPKGTWLETSGPGWTRTSDLPIMRTGATAGRSSRFAASSTNGESEEIPAVSGGFRWV
jgi:hypothetical protein